MNNVAIMPLSSAISFETFGFQPWLENVIIPGSP